MKVIPLWILLISSSLISHRVLAQHNLIDVPTSDILETEKLFFQEQAIISKDGINSSTIFTYGLGKGFEMGLIFNQLHFKNSHGLEVNPDKPEENPDLLVNMQKGFDVNPWIKVGVGTKSGVNAARHNNDVGLVSYNYLNSQYSLANDKFKILAGVYHANRAYVGEGTNFGVMGGVDVTLIAEKLNFMADFHSGNSSISVINAGFEISLPREWKIAIAAQLPVPGSDNNSGGVFQISKN